MKKMSLCIILFGLSSALFAQDKVNVGLGADFVSSYVWRGIKQTGVSVQPALSAGYKEFTLGAWASTDVASGNDKGFKEVDFSLSYSVNRLNLAVTDYWWDGEGTHHYFSYPRDGYSGHILEGTVGYTFPQAFPLRITWNTFFMGRGNKKENGNNSFSTYVELAYPFSVNKVNMGISAGFVPWESVVYGPDADSFKFTNIKLHAGSGIKFSDSFTLPIFGDVIFNPAVEDVHFVFGLSLSID